jgi:sec-independent protein translocase protein TatA
MLPQLGPLEMVVVMGVAVLLFGKRLPEVGRQLGKGILEFKKGINGVTDELSDSPASISNYSSSNYGLPKKYDDPPRGDQVYNDSSVPKFELPGEPSTPAETPQAVSQD